MLKLWIISFVLIFATLVLFQLPSEQETALYCEMVKIHQDTNGEYGWPPYKGECSDAPDH